MKEIDPYVAKFAEFKSVAARPEWLLPRRQAALQRFHELGYPTLKDEDWRFTNVGPITRLGFRPVLNPSRHKVTSSTLGSMVFAPLTGPRLVFVDGHFAAELSHLPEQPAGITVGSLRAGLAEGAPGLEAHLAQHADAAQDAFTALNNAFFTDGALILVPEQGEVPEPVQVWFLYTGRQAGNQVFVRNLVVCQPGSKLTLLEYHANLATDTHVTNTVSEYVIGREARVEVCKFQDETRGAYHIGGSYAHLAEGSRFALHSIVTGARLSRHSIRTVLAGRGVEAVLNGLYLTREDQLADHHMVVEHAQPDCASHEYFNGILDDRSKGVFHGRILVRPEAQKTDAKQTNKNLLLSDSATIDTKPQLEIYADDVKCTHGATIGQLDQDAIFYLRARGIGLDIARRMLIHSFAGEIIDRIECRPVHDILDRVIWDRLEENPHVTGEGAAQKVRADAAAPAG